jgi:transposase
MMKLLLYDRTGAWIFYKRLSRGTFEVPATDDARVRLDPADLALILEGIDLSSVTRRKRYQRAFDQVDES